jgi:hypothetical protein
VSRPNFSCGTQVRPVDGIDQSTTEALVRSVRQIVTAAHLPTQSVTISGTPTLTAALAVQVRRELPVLGIAAIAVVGLCFAPANWMGNRRRRALPLLISISSTSVVLAIAGWARLPLSLGAVAFLPVLFGISSYYPLYLANRTARRQVVVAALATATSFSTLLFSPLPFVRELGLALAAGVVVAVALSLLMLRQWPNSIGVQELRAEESRLPRPAPPPWKRAVLLAALSAAALTGWATLPVLPVAADPQRLAQGLPALADAERAENVLGSSGEIDIVLRGPDVLVPNALIWSREAQSAVTLAHGDALQPIVSVSDLLGFLGDHPTAEEITAALQLVPPYLSGAAVQDDRASSAISFGIRLQDLQAQSRLLADVRKVLPPTPPGYRAEIVGLPVAAARGYDLVSQSRYSGNMLGILAAAAVLLVGLRRRGNAVRAVLAASLATGWGLAIIWVTGQQLSPLTVALGSLTAAVGCEFTVLLANAGHQGRVTFQRSVGTAALTSAAGFFVLTLSGLYVLRQFGIFLAGSVILCYLASRLVVWLLPHKPGHSEAAPTPILSQLKRKVGVQS